MLWDVCFTLLPGIFAGISAAAAPQRFRAEAGADGESASLRRHSQGLSRAELADYARRQQARRQPSLEAPAVLGGADGGQGRSSSNALNWRAQQVTLLHAICGQRVVLCNLEACQHCKMRPVSLQRQQVCRMQTKLC